MMPAQQQPNLYTGGYESFANKYINRSDVEKTFIDKVLDRQDIERIRELMKKKDLDTDDLSELLFLVSGIASKLSNFNDWDRYLLGKFFAWIRDFITLLDAVITYKQDLKDETKKLLENNNTETALQLKEIIAKIKKLNTENCKFLVDVFQFLSNSTLSIEATAFDTLTKSRYEYWYPGMQNAPQMPQQKSGFNIFMKK